MHEMSVRLNGTKARLMYRQNREDAKDNLISTLRAGAIQLPTWFIYSIVDELHARDTEPALLEDEVWLRVHIAQEAHQ